MDGLDAGVMDTPELDTPEVEVDDAREIEAESDASSLDSADDPARVAEQSDDPYNTRFGRDYRAYLNGLKQTDPNAAKYVKQARDDYGRAFAMNQLEPRGIDGIREKYALLDTLNHGEAKGSEAITAMQQSLQEWDDFDQAILAGDPKAFEGITPEFDAGMAKLAPQYLERVAKSDPAAFESAILPHVVSTLAKSEALTEFNYLVDIFLGKYGQLDGQTLYARTFECLKKMGTAFNAMETKAGEIKAAPVDQKRAEFDTERSAFEQEKQKLHWDTKIEPKVQAHEKSTFDKLFDPYQKRLKLGDAQKAGAFKAFHQGIITAAQGDQDFQRQYKLYKSQKSPDAAAVANFINVALSKYGKTAMDELVKDRYEPFLTGQRKPQQNGKPGIKVQGAVGPNVEVRTVKPSKEEIDFIATGRDGVWNNRFVLKNGKTVQVRSA